MAPWSRIHYNQRASNRCDAVCCQLLGTPVALWYRRSEKRYVVSATLKARSPTWRGVENWISE
jgi:hypothetical protein